MANKSKKTSTTAKRSSAKKVSQNATKITRITASDTPKVTKRAKKTPTKPTIVHKATPNEKAATRTASELKESAIKPSAAEIAGQKAEKQKRRIGNPLASLLAYFRGAWYELRQVRWPDRINTWKMTGALLLFCAFFVVLILLLDTAFGTMFEWIIR